MKLLFDENISFRVVSKLIDIFPNSIHAKDIELPTLSDIILWNYARKNGFAIVTFDADFYEYSLVKGTPPKIIWLRFGNNSTNYIAEILRINSELITAFTDDGSYLELSCLEID